MIEKPKIKVKNKVKPKIKKGNKVKINSKNLYLLSIILSFLFIIFLNINFVSAVASTDSTDRDNVTLIVDHIANDGVINTNTAQKIIVNISIRSPAERNYTNAIAYIQGGGLTANSTLFDINTTAAITNATSSNVGVTRNISISINASNTKFEDGTDYTLTINLFNGTTRFNTTATVTLDNNGAPPAPTSLLPTSELDNDDLVVNFSFTVNSSATTSCAVNFTNVGPQYLNYNGVYSTTSCSLNLLNVPDNEYTWVGTASDGTNTTRSTAITTSVSSTKTKAIPKTLLKQVAEKKTKEGVLDKLRNGKMLGMPAIPVMVGIIIIVLILIVLTSSGKRR